MILIQQILVSEDILRKNFTCNLQACKGACCWEGDWGAPLEDQEVEILDQIHEKIRPFLTAEGNEVIETQGTHTYYPEIEGYGTPLIRGASCAYLTFDDRGIGQCGIERAYKAGEINFQKPVSCHLYPLRHKKLENVDFEALNYESWNICNPACTLGDKLQMPVFRFVKDALIRKFGPDFYAELDKIAEDLAADGDDATPLNII